MSVKAVTLDGEKKLACLNGARVNGISRGHSLAVELASCRKEFGDAKKREPHTFMLGLHPELHNHTLHFAAPAAPHPDHQRARARCVESASSHGPFRQAKRCRQLRPAELPV